MKVTASDAPTFSIFPSGINATIYVNGVFDINTIDSKASENLLAAEFRAESVINVAAVGDRLKINIADVRTKIGLTSLNNLIIDAIGIQVLIDEALESFLPMVNDSLDEGVPLPKSKNVDFVNNEICLNDGYIFISSNFN